MSGRVTRIMGVTTPVSAPVYEARARRHGPGDTEIEVWQMPRQLRLTLPRLFVLPVSAAGTSN